MKDAVISAATPAASAGAAPANRSLQDGFFPSTSRLRFGVFEVNLHERELRKFGLRIRLQQKPFKILERLLQTPGEFVSREELARILWPNLHVLFDRSLNTAVNALRRALGDRGRNPSFIETRPGLGYVFIATVEPAVVEPPPLNRHRAAHPHPSHTSAEPQEAYQDYLKGRYFAGKMTEPDIRKSVAYFESALARDARDSHQALAHSGLADSWLLFALYGLLPPQECFARARQCAASALRFDDLLPEAHTSVAAIRFLADWDRPAAESSYQRALKLNADDAAAHRRYAHYLAATGRAADARIEIDIAQGLDPVSLVVNVERAWVLYLAHDFSAAAEQSWKTLAMEPRFAAAQNTLGLAYQQLGMMEEAIVELDNARVCSENHPATLAALAHALAVAGRLQDAESSLADLEQSSLTRYVSPYWFAIAHAGLRRPDRALDALDEAFHQRDPWLVWLDVEPRFDSLRDHPRFEDLIRRIGLTQSRAMVSGR